MIGKWIGLVFSGLLLLPVALAPTAASAATPEAVELPAQVEVSLELRKGDDTASSNAVVDLDTEAKFGFGEGGREVKMKIARVGDGGTKLQVKFSFVRDGKTIVRSKTVQANVGKTQEVKLDGGTVMALTLSPKASHRIEMPDGDDPLSGLQ